MWSHGIVGPFFHDTYVTSESYLRMLKEEVLPWLEHHPAYHPGMIWMQDGAPAHYSIIVRQYLNDEFQN